MRLDTLKALYIAELKDLYSAERQIVKALPKMIKATKHPEQSWRRHTNRRSGG